MAFGMRRAPFKWEFKCVSGADYVLLINFSAENKFVHQIFEKAKRHLKRAKGLRVEGSVDRIARFEIPGQFLKLIDTGIGKEMKIIACEVGADGVIIQNFKVVGAWFERVEGGEDWNMFVKLEGLFSRKVLAA